MKLISFKKIITLFLIISFLFSNISFAFNNDALSPYLRTQLSDFRETFRDTYFFRLNDSELALLKKQPVPMLPAGILGVLKSRRTLTNPASVQEKRFLSMSLMDVLSKVREKAGLEQKVKITTGVLILKPGRMATMELDFNSKTLTVDLRFLSDVSTIESHDIIFRFRFPDGTIRLLSLAQGIKHFAAMHEMRWSGKGGGYIYINKHGKLEIDPDETTANNVGKRYAVIMAAMWLWLEHSYMAGTIDERLRYDNSAFEKRVDGVFTEETTQAYELRSEFPALLADPESLAFAKKLALWINYKYFIEPWIKSNKKRERARSVYLEDQSLSELRGVETYMREQGKSFEELCLAFVRIARERNLTVALCSNCGALLGVRKRQDHDIDLALEGRCDKCERAYVTTLKTPGIPALAYNSDGYKYILSTQINGRPYEEMQREKLILLRNIIASHAPPEEIILFLNSVISHSELDVSFKGEKFKGGEIKKFSIRIVDLGDKTYFSSQDSKKRYYEFTAYDEEEKHFSIYLTKAFYYKYIDTEAHEVMQAMLHALLEDIAGLSHQEAVFLLSNFNHDKTLPRPGQIVISDIHRAILTEIKEDALNGDVNAITYLDSLFNPDLTLPQAQKEALRAQGKTPEEIDNIRMVFEELARQINGIVRGPAGKIHVPSVARKISMLNVHEGSIPPQEILNQYSLAANATMAAALAVVADGYRGKVKDLTKKTEVRVIKDGADKLAKQEIQVVFNLSQYRIIVTVSEGGLRDEVEDSFEGGDIIGKGFQIRSIALDVIENTNATAEGNADGTSIAVVSNEIPVPEEAERVLLEGKGFDYEEYLVNAAAQSIGGAVPDVYANIVATKVPKGKIEAFTGQNSIDPDAPVQDILERIAKANDTTIGRLEVTILGRMRETERLKALKNFAVAHAFDKKIVNAREIIDPILDSKRFNDIDEIKNYVVELATLRFLLRCESYSKEFKMSDKDRGRLKVLNRELDLDINLHSLIRLTESIAKDRGGESLDIVVIQDGTFMHGLLSSLGRVKGKLKILLSTSGAPEAFMNIMEAKIFHASGAIASARLMSNKALKGVTDLSDAYNFSGSEIGLIKSLRESRIPGDGKPNDAQEILNGEKIFTIEDISSNDIDGSVTFVTENDLFGQPGIKYDSATREYNIVTLRTRLVEGRSYAWLENSKLTLSSGRGIISAVRLGGERRIDKKITGTTRLDQNSPNKLNQVADHLTTARRFINRDLERITTQKMHQPEKILVFMNAGLIEKHGPMDPVLQQQYKIMMQNVRKRLNDGEGLIEVSNPAELLQKASKYLANGYKIIILDRNGAFNEALEEISDEYLEKYCVIDIETLKKDREKGEYQFINLNSMVALGLGILYRDGSLFRNAYLALMGKEPLQSVLDDVVRGVMRIIKILPIIVRFDPDDIDSNQRLKKLFAVAA